MDRDHILQEAAFDPRVRTYWLLSGALIFVLSIVGIPFLLLWFPLGYWLTGRYLARMACELTPRALKVRKGLMVRVEKTLPLEKITDMALVQGPLMRWLGIQRLSVETAGQSGAGALVSLTGIVDAKTYREAVLAQRDALSERRGGEAEAPPAATRAASSDTALLTDIRDTLQRIERHLEARN